jgi:ADP-ribosyl-[dinitrogen reductase] hydrolase
MIVLANRIRGCILGGAIGDAVGAAYEGQKGPIEIDPRIEWMITDDTQLTLATCEAIVLNHGRVDPEIIAERYAEWFRQERLTGLGASTYQALSGLRAGGHWALVGRRGEGAAGNGAAMRIAPLAFCVDPSLQAGRQILRDVCRITHHNDEAYVGALAVVLAVRAAHTGRWTGGPELLSYIISEIPDSCVRDRLRALELSEEPCRLHDLSEKFECSGYVVDSIPLALYATAHFSTFGFERLISETVGCGGDTDTNASIAGQIAGTMLGCEQLPSWMLDKLPQCELIAETAMAFASAVTGI